MYYRKQGKLLAVYTQEEVEAYALDCWASVWLGGPKKQDVVRYYLDQRCIDLQALIDQQFTKVNDRLLVLFPELRALMEAKK